MNKRNRDAIPEQESDSLLKKNETKGSVPCYSLKKQKMNTDNKKAKENSLLINLKKSWLKWKLNSCRLDSFFTILIFTILGDERFNVDSLTGRENRKMKEIVDQLLHAKTLEEIQPIITDFALYRQMKLKEKVGEDHSIVPLFMHFGNSYHFLFSIQDNKVCNCGFKIERNFNLGPLIALTSESLKICKGNINSALNLKFQKFLISCPQCKSNININRKVSHYPTFLIALLEFCDDYNTLDSRKSFEDFPSIILNSELKLNKSQDYILSASCYFQAKHYSTHVNQVSLKVIGLNAKKWHFHDGLLNDGRLIEGEPEKEFDIKNDELIPYILVYKLKN